MRIRSVVLATLGAAFALAGCRTTGEIDESGGITAVRSACPNVAIAANTGDVTLFDPADRRTQDAIDVTAAITDLRATCGEAGSDIQSTATFTVVASRRDYAAPRELVLPYYSAVVQAGDRLVAKRVGQVVLRFDAGQPRAVAQAQVAATVSRAAATLPADIRRQITRRRKPGDPDAALDPLAVPAVRDAVLNATFEHLVGFNLSGSQLQYNATR